MTFQLKLFILFATLTLSSFTNSIKAQTRDTAFYHTLNEIEVVGTKPDHGADLIQIADNLTYLILDTILIYKIIVVR